MKHAIALSLLFFVTQACSSANSQKDVVEKASDAVGQAQAKQGNGEDIAPRFKSEKDKTTLLTAHCDKVKQMPDDYSEEDRILCSKE